MAESSPKNRQDKWIMLSAFIWACTYIVGLLVIRKLDPPQAVGIACSVLPAVGFAWFLIQYVRGIRRMDELARRIQLEATAIAFCLCILMLMVLGLLDLVLTLDPENWSLRHLIPFPFIFYFIGLARARHKYA